MLDFEKVRASFVSPLDSARPWAYWFWMNGNLSKEGIRADLEAMSRVGIGGALIMSVGFQTPAGQYSYLSDGWRELFAFATTKHAFSKFQFKEPLPSGLIGPVRLLVTNN